MADINNNQANVENTDTFPRHHRAQKPRDRFFKVRNILNIIFMLGAIGGVLLYFFVGNTVGTIVMLIAVVFKIVECALRFIH